MKPFSFLAQTLSNEGSPSAMRLLMLLGAACIMGVWTLVCVKAGAVQEFPQSVIEVLGLLVLGKVAEKHIENRNPPPPSVP